MHTSFKIEPDWLERVKNLTSGSETVSLFCYKAMEEKVKRMESRDLRAKEQNKKKMREILEPMIREILKEREG